MFELAEEALDLVVLAVERRADAVFSLTIGFGGVLGTAPWPSIGSRTLPAS